jgi:tyrosine-protein kinase
VASSEQRSQIRRAIRSVRAEVRTARKALRARRPGADVQLALATQKLSQLETLGDVNRPVEVVRRAQEPDGPIAPRPVRDTIIGGVLGLVFGLLLAFALAALDRRLRSTAEVQEELDLPVVGRIGTKLLGTAALPSANGRPDEPDLEAVRMLRTNIDFLGAGAPLRTVVVTSALPEEGKSTVAVALAATAATRPGARVLLMECDLRRPVLAERLGLRAHPGLSDYLAGHAAPADVLQTFALPGAGDGGPRLVCITAGTAVPRPAELLQTERMKELVAQLREVYDLVVLDATPLLAVVDALELVTGSDGVLFCVRAGRTTREQARAAAEALAKLPARPTGVVVTGLRASEDQAYGSYSYIYGEAPKAPSAA